MGAGVTEFHKVAMVSRAGSRARPSTEGDGRPSRRVPYPLPRLMARDSHGVQ